MISIFGYRKSLRVYNEYGGNKDFREVPKPPISVLNSNPPKHQLD